MILNWLRRKLINRRRAIFRYWDGRRMRAIDPMTAYRALLEHPEFDWETTPKEIDLPNERLSSQALGLTADAVRQAFDIAPLDDRGGLTEIECLEVLQVFVASMMALKKNISPQPTSPEPTESESSESDSPTKSSSDSGSTSTAKNSAAATVS